MPKSPDSSGGILAPVLISLLATVLIGAGGFGAGYGMGVVRYEILGDQLPIEKVQEEQEETEPSPASALGLTIREENGVVTWINDSWMSGQSSTDTPTNSSQAISDAAEQQPDSQIPSSNVSDTEKPNSGTAVKSDTESQTSGAVNISPNQPQTLKPNTATIPNSGTQSSSKKGDFSNGQVLATRASDNKGDPVYHTKYCSAAQKISESDQIWYPSAKAAQDDGRRICGNCDR